MTDSERHFATAIHLEAFVKDLFVELRYLRGFVDASHDENLSRWLEYFVQKIADFKREMELE